VEGGGRGASVTFNNSEARDDYLTDYN